MPPKKQRQTPKNAFFYFMLDLKDSQGKSFKNMQEVSKIAGEHWLNMSKEQKRPYEEKALLERNNLKITKYTSDGENIETVERLEKEALQRVEEMKNNINEEFKMAYRDGNIQDKMIYLIHINCFCYCTSENRYYPAEIAISGFNLLDGVQPENVYHSIVKPGYLPLGYASEALKLSNETHQIAPPMGDDIENNIEQVYFAIKEFLQTRMRGSKRMPVLYCHNKYMQMVQDVLNNWCEDYGDHNLFKVYDLQYMFRVLKNTVAGNNVWLSDSFSDREIEKDVNSFAKGIACEYHDQTNVPVYCSRSIVVRYAYTVCDNCCPDLQIPFVPGCHVPLFALVASSRPSSVASSRSSRSSRSKASSKTIREDDSESVISVSTKSEWENESVTSEVSAINDDRDYPSLPGPGKRNSRANNSPWGFTPNDTSSMYSQSSTRSYAGAMGTSGLSRRPSDMPSSMTSRMETMSLNSSTSNVSVFSLGRGVARDFSSSDDFPSLERGRGVRPKGRGVARPNNK